MGSRVERTRSKVAAGGPGRSYIHLQKNPKEQLGNDTDRTAQGSSMGK